MANGLPTQFVEPLRYLVDEYVDISHVKLGSDPPLKVKELERLGLVRRNPDSAWACAPLIATKDGPEQFRFTTDLRPMNKVTIPHAWPMPDLESMVVNLAGNKCFATIELCQGYWQLPLAEESQECQSFITPDGVYSPARVIHGQRNAVAFCQSSVQEICSSILSYLLLWLDGIIFHTESSEKLLDVLREFFSLCRQLKLHAKKCKLFLKEVRWCGRIISCTGIRMDPCRLQALLYMPYPTKGEELQQFVCAANWMRAAILEFTSITSPLTELLEVVYQKAGGRTKKRAAKVSLHDSGWGDEHAKAFGLTKHVLEKAVELAHPDAEKLFCLFTDACDRHCSGIFTQIPPEDLDCPSDQQRHEPLEFLSGSFKGSSFRWLTLEKEAAGILNSVEPLDYLRLRPQGFYLFTDHSNMVYIYHPERATLHMNKTVYNKVRRCGIVLSYFDYNIIHISGEENCWADLLSRWGAKDSRTGEARDRELEHLRIASLFRALVAPDLDPHFFWPSITDNADAQASVSANERMKYKLAETDGVLRLPSGQLYIPAENTHLQLRVGVTGHCGRAGHRGCESTCAAIKDFCFWADMDEDISSFCSSSLHCVYTLGGTRSQGQWVMQSTRTSSTSSFILTSCLWARTCLGRSTSSSSRMMHPVIPGWNPATMQIQIPRYEGCSSGLLPAVLFLPGYLTEAAIS